ncbi:MAG: glutamate-5-semialdehyde dehydrogenase [Allosphingosinicella sp.]|uniref:glutamate-5-semialdehyde dehydrogenase n=1 Tax=Allosphingosinicella sp. TaxID=2823234 RepID=UPI0039523DCA
MTLADTMHDMGARAAAAAAALRDAPADARSAAIRAMTARLRARADEVLAANARDVARAAQMVDRLRLDPERLEGIASGLDQVAALPDPVGAEMARWRRPNGLDIARVRTPIGVIGMIFESRPNVAADAAAICLRAGNALILRGGSDALGSCLAIHAALAEGLREAGLPADAVQMVPTADRDAVGLLLGGLGGAVDLIVPRGGKALVARVEAEARVPVLGHLEGICHSFVHASADPEMARAVVVNAKLRRVSICGATETLLVDEAGAARLLPGLAEALRDGGCALRGDAASRAVVPWMESAAEADWSAEYLAPVLAVRIVDGVEGAAAHIARYGSGHTEAIVAEDEAAAERFLALVDSAIVMWNASTQFADGGEFGFGAEIGIATGRLHARGPVGPEQLTTFKYVVRGTGQTRP